MIYLGKKIPILVTTVFTPSPRFVLHFRLLYFTAGSYYYDSKIVKANMDGSNVTLLKIDVQGSSSLPEGICVDHVSKYIHYNAASVV